MCVVLLMCFVWSGCLPSAAGPELLAAALRELPQRLGLGDGWVQGLEVFLFGSPQSLSAWQDDDLAALAGPETRIHLNIGLESLDQATLEQLKRPVDAATCLATLERLLRLSRSQPHIEASVNLLVGEGLPATHLPRMETVLRHLPARTPGQIRIYLSPLAGACAPSAARTAIRRLQGLTRLEILAYPLMPW